MVELFDSTSVQFVPARVEGAFGSPLLLLTLPLTAPKRETSYPAGKLLLTALKPMPAGVQP